MLAVKGVCTLCKDELSIFHAGLVCCYCEKFYHGSCCYPPLAMADLQKYVTTYSSWYCEKCYGKSSKDVTFRSAQDRQEVEKKLDLLNQVRDIIIKIEDTINALAKRCKLMNENAAALAIDNAELRKTVTLHEKYAKQKPKNFRQWRDQRKHLGVNKREKKSIKYWLPLKSDVISKGNDLKVYLKKQRGMTEKEAKRQVKKKVKAFHKAPDSSLSFQLYNFINNLTKSRLVNVVLLGVIFLYTLFGATVYRLVEGTYESYLREEILKQRRLVNSWSSDRDDIVDSLDHYFEFLYKTFSIHSSVLRRGDDDLAWDFIDAIYFCGMTYTTVGYGDITPMTTLGKLFTIFYAFFGIPMFLLLLASLGNYVCKGILFDISLLTKYCLKLCCSNSSFVKNLNDVEEYDDGTRALVDQGCSVFFYFTVTLVILFLIGAVMFMIGENLGFITALYFVFITLSTLGFGEVVPNNRPFMIGAIFYMVIGLTLVSTAINAIMYLLQDKLTTGVEKLGKKVDELD